MLTAIFDFVRYVSRFVNGQWEHETRIETTASRSVVLPQNKQKRNFIVFRSYAVSYMEIFVRSGTISLPLPSTRAKIPFIRIQKRNLRRLRNICVGNFTRAETCYLRIVFSSMCVVCEDFAFVETE